MSRCAVVFFNLGGPDKLDSVEPFLFNLFSDRAIIDRPNPFRYLLAKLISHRRAPVAREIYKLIGGSSPLLAQTTDQAIELEKHLSEIQQDKDHKVFIAMRYWHPFADDVAKQVKEYDPEQIVLLPLYPQFSTTTTGSSLTDWDQAAARAGLNIPTARICCYPFQQDFISSYCRLISPVLTELGDVSYRILFSAHGLPQKTVDKGDPYQWQVEQTVQAIVNSLDVGDIDWVTCYQSRVGPVKWISPSTEDEIRRAATDKKAVIIVPIAFVSEHSETLVELDIEYAALAQDMGISCYQRVQTVFIQREFIKSLGKLVTSARIGPIDSSEHKRICPRQFSQCPHQGDAILND